MDSLDETKVHKYEAKTDNANEKKNQNAEAELDNMVEDLVECQPGKNIEFLINASNQANLNKTSKGPFAQINALFVLIHPYTLDDLNFTELDVNIRMNGHDSIIVDGERYEIKELHPGIRIFGIINEKRGDVNEVQNL